MKMKFLRYVLLVCLPTLVLAGDPVELGEVNWLRDYDQARTKAQESDKPIFLLFQEVPGCMTCRNYGTQVLSHPFVVEAIETYFVPLAVFNNRGGKDAAVLKAFSEPSWNNPVVRMISAEGGDLVERLNGDYTALGLVDRMIETMHHLSIRVPDYLLLTREELLAQTQEVDKVTMSMYCFWTGEKTYGKIDGVLKTEAGFMDGREVVDVWFDPDRVGIEELIKEGQKGSSADGVYYHDKQQAAAAREQLEHHQVRQAKHFREDREPQYYLSKSKYRVVPMSPLQRTKVNAMLGQGQDPTHLLSPRQLAFLRNEPKSRYRDEQWMETLNRSD